MIKLSPMESILHQTIPFETARRPLPGVRGLKMSDWLLRDEVFSAQMALREALVDTRRRDVIAAGAGTDALCVTALRFVVDWLARHDDGYEVHAKHVTRPDGVVVALDENDPLATLARLVQEDVCLLGRQGDAHVLRAAVVCFPAGWRLAEKIGRPLVAIHEPVPSYDAKLAARVQRLFDAVQPDQPLWRFNALDYLEPDLFQPDKRSAAPGEHARYFRSERQAILRLPEAEDDACIFSIHTYVLRTTDAERRASDPSQAVTRAESAAPTSGA